MIHTLKEIAKAKRDILTEMAGAGATVDEAVAEVSRRLGIKYTTSAAHCVASSIGIEYAIPHGRRWMRERIKLGPITSPDAINHISQAFGENCSPATLHKWAREDGYTLTPPWCPSILARVDELLAEGNGRHTRERCAEIWDMVRIEMGASPNPTDIGKRARGAQPQVAKPISSLRGATKRIRDISMDLSERKIEPWEVFDLLDALGIYSAATINTAIMTFWAGGGNIITALKRDQEIAKQARKRQAREDEPNKRELAAMDDDLRMAA